MLVLHNYVEDDEAVGARREVHPALVVLVGAEEDLGVLAVVQSFQEDAGDEHADSLAVLEGEPQVEELGDIGRGVCLFLLFFQA